MAPKALTACLDAITEDSIEIEKLAQEIKWAAFRGDDAFIAEIAGWAASYVDDMVVKNNE